MVLSPASVCAAVIARDEELEIAQCLQGLVWADQVLVVVDAASRDRTAEIARSFTPDVAVMPFQDYARQRNAALGLARTGWVFFVDADERVSVELAQEVRSVTAAPGDMVGYWVPRRNIIFGRWVRHTGWYPDYQLRLLRLGHAKYDEERLVHEVVLLDGPAGYLRNPLVHYNYRSLAEFQEKQERYSRLEALTLYRQGVRPKARSYLSRPAREFWRRFVSLQGYRDGPLGLLLSLLMARYSLSVCLKLRALWRQ